MIKSYGANDLSDENVELTEMGLRREGRFAHAAPWRNEIWHEGPGQIFSEKEIEDSNRRMRDENSQALIKVKEDGYLRYPLWVRNIEGELVEKETFLHPEFEPSCTEDFFARHGMDTNIYVPSYERAGTAGTMKLFDRFGVKNYYICIDPSQYEKYRQIYPARQLVIRDIAFRDPDMLEPHSSLRHPISMAGHAPLCNFTLALSRSLGEHYFTFADDDFVGLAMKAKKGDQLLQPGEVYDKNEFYRCSNIMEEYGFNFQQFWHRLELLIEHMRNPGFVGLERFGTVFSLPVSFRTGTRVYSFYLTDNRTQIAHEGRQNNDVQTSIALSKHGLVNTLFEGVSYNSAQTQSGGGQSEMYKRIGTFDKGKVLVRAQPSSTKIIDRYSRIHHSGDFSGYSGLRTVGAVIEPELNS